LGDGCGTILRVHEYPRGTQGKANGLKFKGRASARWEQLQISHGRQGKGPMTSWMKMKRLLKARFLPPDFEHRLFQQHQECQQGARIVQAYVNDFYRLYSQNDLMETSATGGQIYWRVAFSDPRPGIDAYRLHTDRSR
jgi:hypothetical protein